MTTIAYDGKVLAADSKITAGTMVFGTSNKITKLNDGRLLAFSGATAFAPAVVDWLNGGDKPELEKDESCSGLIVFPDGRADELSSNLRLFPACIPWAGGSGEQVAMTAMRCGKSAEDAVRLACEMDIYSGLPVCVVTL